MVKNVYIHIPFCRQKCHYCSFVSFPKPELIDKYLVSLEQEIKNKYEAESLNTLYFGGGTPSLLNIKDFERLVNLFNTDDKTEITSELNPEHLDYEYLKNLKAMGINRISLGCQTFASNILKIIGRKHSPQDVINSVNNAQKAGFNNINLDFIYGLPNQSIESFANDLTRACNLGIQHISLYGLKIDEGCHFYNNPPENIADEDIQAEMYLKAIEILKSNNFEHYEISNFAKENYPSNHNLNYWNNNSYYGFGVSAHGYVNGVRYSNNDNLQDYIENPFMHKFEHKVTNQEKLEEEIFLGFRKMQGININEINKKFGINFLEKYSTILKKYIDTKYLIETNTGFKLSDSGILISNSILSDFIE